MAQYKQFKLSFLVAAASFSSLSYGAGFAIQEQSVTGLGQAFAGSAAVAEDASTIFFNPAGLTYLSHSQFIGALHYIKPKHEFTDDGSTINPLLGGAPITGNDDDGGKEAFVPNLYYAHKFNDNTFAGIGINAPLD